MRILLAEDEIALAKALVKIFENNNYSIDAVHDGQDALDYLEAGNYDAIYLETALHALKRRKNGISLRSSRHVRRYRTCRAT